MESDAAYLVDDADITVRLLADPLLWRVRAVDELMVDAGASYRRRRSLQCGPLRDFLPETNATSALVAVPLTSMPRGPLLDFDVEGPSGNAWLLPRVEIASREARYLASLVEGTGGAMSKELLELLEAIVGFADGYLFDDQGRRKPLFAFLEDGLELPLPTAFVSEAGRLSYRTWSVLRPRSHRPDRLTAPEFPAMGLPELFTSGACSNLDDALNLLREYTSTVLAMSLQAQEGTSPEAAVFLDVLADYGHNYDLTVATKVPVDEPFTLKFEERRGLDLSRWRNQGRIELFIADAKTNHVTFRVDDASVRIASCNLLPTTGGSARAVGAFVARRDDQTRSYYYYDERDYQAVLSFRLSMLIRLTVVPYLVALLLVVLAGALVVRDVSDPRDVALIATPASIAAGVLGVRESSTLGSGLRLLNSTLVASSLALLIAAATWQLVVR